MYSSTFLWLAVIRFVFGMALLIVPLPARTQTLRIAAAADLQYVMPELIKGFVQKHPKVRLEVVYGSSGNFTMQIQSGAPFDVFFSADMRYPTRLSDVGLTTAKPQRYATGQMVVWIAAQSLQSIQAGVRPMNLHFLRHPGIRRIAIANPLHAPYGERAQEALKTLNLWTIVENRLVKADNVAQAAQFAATDNVEAAIISLSQAMIPALTAKGKYALINKTLYSPLEQGVVILSRSKERVLAEKFIRYICSSEGALVLTQFGFLP